MVLSGRGARVAGVEAPLALYRRYRPETFAEVIGQDHVTAPLRNALSNNRVNHAYLFSGPRGCGKTTSARILARAINCEKGPIAEPCGVCKSCTDLARGGPGSIDVIEIDAASHGGVDDARDLRERAFFAPVESRYKIYIIDEAHMVTTQGFNALLKLVEEPPPHLKFIFATTEPDKVIGTIRSRTHHYPFRLVPPKVLGDYMASLCQSEGVAIESAALPLVVRAGAGSVRDSLSVLDQLIGGAGPEGVTYELAVALLGFTPDSLLDACVDGFAAHDSAAVFETIEKVIETGQDPKRFAEDLLRRLRDLVVLSAVPNAVASGLIEAAEDQGERLQTQAAGIGSAELTRAADIVAAGLLEMRGATAPRLQLELICAKVLLPGADDSTNGIQARLDRMERRLTIGVPTTTPDAAPAAPSGLGGGASQDAAASRAAVRAAAGAVGTTPDAATATEAAADAEAAAYPAPAAAASSGVAPSEADSSSAAAGGDAAGAGAGGGTATGGALGTAGSGGAGTSRRGAGTGDAGRGGAVDGGASGSGSVAAGAGRTGAWGDESAAPAPVVGAGQAVGGASGTAGAPVGGGSGAPSGGSVGLADIRRLWPEVLEAVKSKRRFAWIMLSQNAQVIAVDDQTLTLGLVNAGARESFARSGSDEILRQAMIDTIGLNRRIEAVVDPSTDPGAGGAHQPAGPRPGGPQAGSPGAGGPGTGGPGAGAGAGGSAGGSGAGSAAGGTSTGGGADGSVAGSGAGGSAAGGSAAGPGVGGQAVDGSGVGGSASGPGASAPGIGGMGASRSGAGGLGAGGAGGSRGGAASSGAGASGSGAGGLGASGAGAGPAGGGGAAAGRVAAAGSASGGVGSAGPEARTGAWGTGVAATPGAGGGAVGGAGDQPGGGQSSVNPGRNAGQAGAGGAAGVGQWGDGAGTAVALQEPPDPEYDDVPPEPDPWDDVPVSRQGPRAARADGPGTRAPGAGQSAATTRQSGGSAGGSGGDRREQAASKRRAAEAAVAAEQARRAAAAPAAPVVPLTPEEEADAIGEDDVVLEEDSRTHTDLLRETLGAQIITEEPN
ncbi:DNA polymerase III subunit gamma and tau [Kribbella sp. NBC_01510]|uniref:DNA polymerase III subunit gamma and tau n=1 Tax=Kribbella sp. NBC_01510 TaxID=2903581 RepID=UPI00386F1199